MTRGAIATLATLANGNGWLVHRARFLDVSFLLGVGDTLYLVRIHRGHVEAVDKVSSVMPRWAFSLRASEEAWATFWQPIPPPGFHDLVAMIKIGAMKLEGDQHPFFANLRYFKELLALPRDAAQATAGGGPR